MQAGTAGNKQVSLSHMHPEMHEPPPGRLSTQFEPSHQLSESHRKLQYGLPAHDV